MKFDVVPIDPEYVLLQTEQFAVIEFPFLEIIAKYFPENKMDLLRFPMLNSSESTDLLSDWS